MPTRDIRSSLEGQAALLAQAISTDTTTAGQIIDTADYDGGIKFDLFASAYTDGTYTPLLEEGNDSGLSDAAAVADANLIGTEAGAALSAVSTQTEVLKSIGYVGSNKRYVRLSIVSTGTSTGATIGVVAQKMPEMTPAAGLSA